jgi:outer membrane scaffolding protein for murein synthesis (MipA/OmpV family)
MRRNPSIMCVLEGRDRKLHSETIFKCVVFAFLIVILQSPCPTYAEIPSEAADIGIAENLPEQEQTDRSRIHGHLGNELIDAKGNLNNKPYRGGVGLIYHVEYNDWIYLSDIGGLEAGVWLWQTPDHMLKLGASVLYRPARRAIDNITRRQASADGVIKLQWRTPERYFLYMDYHHDIGDVNSGGGADLLLSRNFIFRQALFDHDCMLVPAIGARWSSTKRVDYYYGVRPEEATLSQPAYAGRETFIETARLTGFYIINKSWNAFAGAQADIYGPGITDSPIVTRRVTSRGYVGAAWVF